MISRDHNISSDHKISSDHFIISNVAFHIFVMISISSGVQHII